MPDKYSFAKCEQYGRRLAARLCQQRFGAQPDATLDGPALLTFTPLRQVNLLVLQQLLTRWQQEAARLRSPYFDFEAAAVQAALTQFMNVLSRHIQVGRAALEPLLAEAVAAALLLATDPAAAFGRLLLPPAPADAPDAEVPTAYLRERLRYLDASRSFFTGFVDSLPPGPAALSREFLRQRFELYRTSHYKELPALAPLVAELSALLPLTEADLWDDGPRPTAPPKTAPVSSPAAPPTPAPTPASPAPTAAPGAQPVSASVAPPPAVPTAEKPPLPTPPGAGAAAAPPPATQDSSASAAAVAPGATAAQATAAPPVAPKSGAPASPAPAASEPAAPAAVPASTEVLAAAEAPKPAPVEAPPPAPATRPVIPSFVAAPEPAAVPLHEKLRATQPAGPALADTLRGAASAAGAATTLAERGAPRVGSLRAAISINQRYGFINELFNGEDQDYHVAIEQLDQQPTAAAALAYVQQELAPRYDWGRKEEHVGKLLKLIERKFGGA